MELANYSPDIWGSGWLAAPLRNWPIWEWELPGKAKKPYPFFVFLNHTQLGVKDVSTAEARFTRHTTQPDQE